MPATEPRCFRLDGLRDVLTLSQLFGRSKPLRRILELARKRGADCVHVHEGLCKEPHCDKCAGEWGDEVTDLNERAGKTPAREPLCLVFSRQSSGGGRRRAVGCASLRPSPYFSVLTGMVPAGGAPPVNYLTCSARSRVGPVVCENPGNDQRIISASPFCEQVEGLGCCSHSAVRAASLILSATFPGCKALSFPEISRRAGLASPDEGLDQEEIQAALSGAGCEVIVHHLLKRGRRGRKIRSPIPAGLPGSPARRGLTCDELLHLYQESGFPVIVGLTTAKENHALLVVGHGLDSDAWWPAASEDYYPILGGVYEWRRASLWTPGYYVHDDNFGPYMSVPKDYLNRYAHCLFLCLPSSLGIQMKPEQAKAVAAGTSTTTRL